MAEARHLDLGDVVMWTLGALCFLGALSLIAILIGALIGIVPTTTDSPCQERVGGTGKTSGHLKSRKTGWYDLGNQRVYCRDGKIRATK